MPTLLTVNVDGWLIHTKGYFVCNHKARFLNQLCLTFCTADFCWSASNDLILSCSLDGTAMLWYVSSGSCVRTVKDPDNAPIRVCRFQPINNNMIVVSFHC